MMLSLSCEDYSNIARHSNGLRFDAQEWMACLVLLLPQPVLSPGNGTRRNDATESNQYKTLRLDQKAYRG